MGSLTMPERAAFRDPAVKGVSASAAAGSGRIRAVAGEDGVRVYDVPGRRLRTSWTWPRGFTSLPTTAALSPSGATLVVLNGFTMSAWDTMTGRKLREQPVAEGTPRPDLAFGDNEDLVSVTRSGSVELVWNVRTGRTYRPDMEAGLSPAISASGEYIAGMGLNEGMKVIRLSDLSVRPWTPKECHAVAFSPDSTRMYCANGGIQAWDTRTGRRRGGGAGTRTRSGCGPQAAARSCSPTTPRASPSTRGSTARTPCGTCSAARSSRSTPAPAA
jgi:WD40 repeat protein